MAGPPFMFVPWRNTGRGAPYRFIIQKSRVKSKNTAPVFLSPAWVSSESVWGIFWCYLSPRYWIKISGCGVSFWKELSLPSSDSICRAESENHCLTELYPKAGYWLRHSQKGFKTLEADRLTVSYQDRHGALWIHLYPWKVMTKTPDGSQCGH